MRTIIGAANEVSRKSGWLFSLLTLVFGLICAGAVQAQIGMSISAAGTSPNTNAMLDVQSPLTGDGKGMLIPRVTLAQRTTASATLAGGLLNNSGNLRGGLAQGLIVYQTDGVQGLYFNTSLTATPAWVHLGEGSDLDMQGNVISNAIITNTTYYGNGVGITNLPAGAFTEADPLWVSASNGIVANIATRLVSNVWAAADSTTNYLARTGGTMSGALNMGARIDMQGNIITNAIITNTTYYGNGVGITNIVDAGVSGPNLSKLAVNNGGSLTNITVPGALAGGYSGNFTYLSATATTGRIWVVNGSITNVVTSGQ